MQFLEGFSCFLIVLMILLGICYAYQAFYMLYSLIHHKDKRLPEAHQFHRYAILIPARNEEGVIGELIESLKKQNYPRKMFDIYVAADNCSDHTAEIAREHGAIVLERKDNAKKGKGYVLDWLYKQVTGIKGQGYYEAFLIFDADNIVDKNFLKEINKSFDTGEYDAITSYRNSKNFDQNWLTAAYSIWFLHEARHLNDVRCDLHANCMISGTGFLVSDAFMQKNNGWPFYLLTEDIEFSVKAVLDGLRIGYCNDAILYDEQPSSWKQAWQQRLRWTKGFFQIDKKYIGSLIKAVFTRKGSSRLACYDVLMTIAPNVFLMIINISLIVWILGAFQFFPGNTVFFQKELGLSLLIFFLCAWIGLMLIGALTVAMEWKRIQADNWSKIKYLPIFPLFILSYIPISIQALFIKVEWKPIRHHSTSEISEKQKVADF